jgi:hypothetical protein
LPFASVTVAHCPLAREGPARVTVAPGLGVPSGRITLPVTEPVLTACDHAGLVPSNNTRPRMKTPGHLISLDFIAFSLPSRIAFTQNELHPPRRLGAQTKKTGIA